MSRFSTISKLRALLFAALDWRTYLNSRNRNWRGATLYMPGHFYSPLNDISSYESNLDKYRSFNENFWRQIDLNIAGQLEFHRKLLLLVASAGVFDNAAKHRRYSSDNVFFFYPDAFALAGILLHFRPKRVIEVGSGFSSAVMLDACDAGDCRSAVSFIEPDPSRLRSLVSEEDLAKHQLLESLVQDVPIEIFRALEKNDILFVDSSHVVKPGSDVEDLFLRILPSLASGVIIHFHDVFFPEPYPLDWIESGRAWNESIILRVLLLAGQYEILHFNSCLAVTRRDDLAAIHPEFLTGIPASIWLRKL